MSAAPGPTPAPSSLPVSPPELGPMLGRLVRPPITSPARELLATERLALLDRLFARAGDARREVAAGRADLGWARLSPEGWLDEFRRAAAAAAGLGLAEVDRRILAAGQRSRMPARLLARRRPGEEARRILHNRCESAGIPLERLAPAESVARRDDALLRTAIALEEAWEELVGVIERELARWEPVAAEAAGWRRPRGPRVVFTALVVAGALALGLSIGGYLPAPGPLGALQTWWWSLPWP